MADLVYYGTPDGFRAYHDARGNDYSAFDDEDFIEPALLVASEWIDGKYVGQFPGLKVGMRAQIREWPRQGAYDRYGYNIAVDVEPVEIDNATYEAALKQLITPGALVKDWTPAKYKAAQVDTISVQYMAFNTSEDIQTRFTRIDQILAAILTGCGDTNSGLSGATGRA
jgi:hypothetical protein